jgi:hypothetical protein
MLLIRKMESRRHHSDDRASPVAHVNRSTNAFYGFPEFRNPEFVVQDDRARSFNLVVSPEGTAVLRRHSHYVKKIGRYKRARYDQRSPVSAGGVFPHRVVAERRDSIKRPALLPPIQKIWIGILCGRSALCASNRQPRGKSHGSQCYQTLRLWKGQRP